MFLPPNGGVISAHVFLLSNYSEPRKGPPYRGPVIMEVSHDPETAEALLGKAGHHFKKVILDPREVGAA